ncbi:unnamed protein product [Rhodiola kirilowii]
MDLLIRSHMEDVKPISTPAEPGSRLVKYGDPLPDPHLYCSVVGALQYVTITHPELSYAVNRGSINSGLVLRPCTDSRRVAFLDATWASDGDDCRSQHGFAIYYSGNLISWSSKKQDVVAKSSSDTEYRAIAFTATELIWIQQLLLELKALLTPPHIILCDNLSATYMSANPVFHHRSKHIKIDYYFV